MTYQLLVRFSAFIKFWPKKWEYRKKAHHLYIVRRTVLYNILEASEVPMKIVRLIKMCLNETYAKVNIGKYLSDNFPIQNSVKKEMLYHHNFSTLIYSVN
jgi:hypothetical protein